MTNARFELGIVEIEGHAGYSKNGNDIVCAGISALSFGTLLAMEESGAFRQVEYEVESGHVFIRYEEEPGKEEICKNILKVLECGISLICAEFPDNVTTNKKFF